MDKLLKTVFLVVHQGHSGMVVVDKIGEFAKVITLESNHGSHTICKMNLDIMCWLNIIK